MPVKFQARHYEDVADTLALERPRLPEGGEDTGTYAEANLWFDILERFVILFQSDNPNFDPDRFRDAAVTR